MSMDPTKQHEFVSGQRADELCVAGTDATRLCMQPRSAPIHVAPAPSVQCDRCRNWVPQDTVKVQAGVTFCAHCQDGFLDWVATEVDTPSTEATEGETCKWPRKNAWAWRTDCGEDVSVTTAIDLLKRARFCPFCGKEINHE